MEKKIEIGFSLLLFTSKINKKGKKNDKFKIKLKISGNSI